MTLTERNRLWEMVRNPKPGSKVAAAQEFGIDLTLKLRRLGLSPTQRLQELEAFGSFLDEIRRAVRDVRK